VKEFLSRNGIEFEERDLTRDPDALDDLQRIGAMSTPVTVIDGEAVVGFDQARLRELLRETGAVR
jgi:glutaredoxin 3